MPNEQIYLNDEKWSHSMNSLKEIASDMLTGHMGLNDGSLKILAILYRFPDSISSHSAFNAFRALSSETTHIPLTHARKYWHSDSLLKLDQELKEIESRYQSCVTDACQHLLDFDFEQFRFNNYSNQY